MGACQPQVKITGGEVVVRTRHKNVVYRVLVWKHVSSRSEDMR